MKTKEDHRVCIDIGKLTTAVANVRSVAQDFSQLRYPRNSQNFAKA